MPYIMIKLFLHSRLRVVAIILLFIVSFNALAAGYSFIVDPTGQGLGITTDYLRPSAPFDDFLIPGIVLFVVIGILSSLIAGLAIAKCRNYPLYVFFQGSVLVGWIGIQLMMVKSFHPLHLVVSIIGIILILIAYNMSKNL